MSTREIPRAQWVEFLDGFSRQHKDWLVTVEVAGDGVTVPRVEARGLPLEGIAADFSAGHAEAISVIIRGKPGFHLTHFVRAPSRIVLKETPEGAHEAIHIESADGSVTVVAFRSPALSEEVDGLPRTRQPEGA